MAAGGFKEFVAGETLDEDDINDFLMQGVLVFAGTAARGSAITAPVEGQFAWLNDSDSLTYYSGTAWEELSTTPGAAVVSATTGSPSITSGTVIGGTAYDIYEFTGSGSITIDDAGFAELLVVGGGGSGGGGANGGGGGGAGGHLEISQAYLNAGTLTVTVGAGGAANSNASTDDAGYMGNNGSSSRVGDFLAPGGGGGSSFTRSVSPSRQSAQDGLNGGSGGGAGGWGHVGPPAGGLGFAPVGNNGGTQTVSDQFAGGGGGGANAAGADTSNTTAGNGGAGEANSITGSSVTRAGGGGGGTAGIGGGTAGSGGSGGGGAGSIGSTTATSGTVNTGGGGGGSDAGIAGAGGSGIVIVRVAV
jgi:hypothetical protein